MRPIAAGQADELLAVDQWMAGVAPHRGFRVVFLRQVFLPDDFARIGFEADEVALGAERVKFVAIDDRRAAWTGRVRNSVLYRIIVMPLLLAGLFVEALHTLGAGEFLAVEIVDFHVRLAHVIANEYPIGRHGRSGVSACYRYTPHHARTALGKLFDQAIFAPYIIAVRTHPLWPAVRMTERWRRNEHEQYELRQSH